MERGDEAELIRRCLQGDRAAADALVRAHQGPLYSYIYRLCGRHELARDVVQEAFVRALTGLDRFDPAYRFSTWLFTIARRQCLTMLQKKSPDLAADLSDHRVERRTPERLAAEAEQAAELRERLQRALMQLPARQREIIVLFHTHGWTIVTIAGQLGLPEGTVKSHLHRGRARLRELLDEQARRRRPEALGDDKGPLLSARSAALALGGMVRAAARRCLWESPLSSRETA